MGLSEGGAAGPRSEVGGAGGPAKSCILSILGASPGVNVGSSACAKAGVVCVITITRCNSMLLSMNRRWQIIRGSAIVMPAHNIHSFSKCLSPR